MVADALTKPARDAAVAVKALSQLAQQNNIVVPWKDTTASITAVTLEERTVVSQFTPLYSPCFYADVA
jgi:hypothetical protein